MVFTTEVKVAIIAGVTGIGIAIVGNLIKDIKANYVTTVDNQLALNRDPELSAFENRVGTLKEAVNAITGAESKDISTKVSDFKKSINYSDKVNVYRQSAKDELARFKDTINAESRIENAKLKYDERIYNYKVEHGYDAKIKMLNKRISAAEDEYSVIKSSCKNTPDQYKDWAKEFKKTAKNLRNETVDTAKKSIKDLEESFESFKIEQQTIRDAEIDSVNKQISDKKVYLESNANKRIKLLDDQVSDYRDTVSKEIFRKRTKENQEIIDEYECLRKELDDIHLKEAAERSRMINNATFSEKAAVYLHDKGWKQWHVLAVGSIPIVVLEYWIVKYAKWIFNFSKMVKEGVI